MLANIDLIPDSLKTGVAICDRSAWGRIQFTNSDRQTFLHNQTTNDLKSLQPGQGCETMFVTSTARTIDLATAYVLNDAVLMVVSPHRREKILQWCDRYIFFGDKVEFQDLTEQTAMISVIGAGSNDLLDRLGVQPQANLPETSHYEITLAGQSVRLAIGSGLAIQGYTLILDNASKATVWDALLEAGAISLDAAGWEHLRIVQGRPQPDAELTEDYNAVEASLWQAISINKGCYIGQETIARLDTYQGVKQQLWGIVLDSEAPANTPITINTEAGAEKVGLLTSITQVQQGWFGLGYVRTKAGGMGLSVQIGGSSGVLVEVPFLHRSRNAIPI
jgi:tRNA-modifying protein YgfZ